MKKLEANLSLEETEQLSSEIVSLREATKEILLRVNNELKQAKANQTYSYKLNKEDQHILREFLTKEEQRKDAIRYHREALARLGMEITSKDGSNVIWEDTIDPVGEYYVKMNAKKILENYSK